jgi:hypothetical protein
MDREAVETIEKIIGRSIRFDVDGKTFGRDEYGQIKRIFWDPIAEEVKIHTLTGLIDFIKANVDDLDMGKFFVVVKSPTEVFLYSALTEESHRRDVIVHVEVDKNMSTYSFGHYFNVEEFVIALNSLFEESKDRERLIQFVSRVHGGTGFTLSDDGITQIVEVQAGVSGALKDKESAPKIVELQPFRTFRDVAQPKSSFLLRLKLLGEQTVGVCLYEADGGRWRNNAIKSIQTFLEENLEGVTVIA